MGFFFYNGAPEYSPVFSGVRVTRSLVVCVMFCRSLFVPFLLVIVFSVFPGFTDTDYPFYLQTPVTYMMSH